MQDNFFFLTKFNDVRVIIAEGHEIQFMGRHRWQKVIQQCDYDL